MALSLEARNPLGEANTNRQRGEAQSTKSQAFVKLCRTLGFGNGVEKMVDVFADLRFSAILPQNRLL